MAARAAKTSMDRRRRLLPHGGTLPEDAWRRRHHALLVLLWVHVVGLTAFALARGYPLFHSLVEGSAVAVFAVLAMVMHRRRRAASALVSLGLIASSAVLVHIWGGVIEAHFHFFVVLILLTLYEDWQPFILAALYVLLHHGLMGALDASSVYNHEDAIDHPWRWAAIHAVFIVAAGAGAVIAWRLNEDVRAETRVSEERFKSAFENAPIGMALVSMEPATFGRFIQVNRAMCEMIGTGEQQLLAGSVQGAVHADESEETAALLASLLDAEHATAQAEGRWLRADGDALSCVANFSVVHDAAGRAVRAIAQVRTQFDLAVVAALVEVLASRSTLGTTA